MIKKMFLPLAIGLIAVPITLCGWDDGPIPTGKLGFKLGTYLAIEGVRQTNGVKTGTHTIVVDTVNGKKCDQPVSIEVANISTLPEGVRCKINGYETGRMIGVPDEVAEKEKIPVPQMTWQFYRSFVATSIVEPKELKINK